MNATTPDGIRRRPDEKIHFTPDASLCIFAVFRFLTSRDEEVKEGIRHFFYQLCDLHGLFPAYGYSTRHRA